MSLISISVSTLSGVALKMSAVRWISWTTSSPCPVVTPSIRLCICTALLCDTSISAIGNVQKGDLLSLHRRDSDRLRRAVEFVIAEIFANGLAFAGGDDDFVLGH